MAPAFETFKQEVNMSRKIDLDKPLSEEDRAYLLSRNRGYDVRSNDDRFGGGAQEPESSVPDGLSGGQNPNEGGNTPTGGLPGQGDGTGGEEAEDYEKWTIAEMQTEIKRRVDEEGAVIEVGKNAKHADLVAALQLDDEEVAKQENE